MARDARLSASAASASAAARKCASGGSASSSRRTRLVLARELRVEVPARLLHARPVVHVDQRPGGQVVEQRPEPARGGSRAGAPPSRRTACPRRSRRAPRARARWAGSPAPPRRAPPPCASRRVGEERLARGQRSTSATALAALRLRVERAALSTSSPKNSSRTGAASGGLHRSTMPPRTANVPGSSTSGTRVKPSRTSFSASASRAISTPLPRRSAPASNTRRGTMRRARPRARRRRPPSRLGREVQAARARRAAPSRRRDRARGRRRGAPRPTGCAPPRPRPGRTRGRARAPPPRPRRGDREDRPRPRGAGARSSRTRSPRAAPTMPVTSARRSPRGPADASARGEASSGAGFVVITAVGSERRGILLAAPPGARANRGQPEAARRKNEAPGFGRPSPRPRRRSRSPRGERSRLRRCARADPRRARRLVLSLTPGDGPRRHPSCFLDRPKGHRLHSERP